MQNFLIERSCSTTETCLESASPLPSPRGPSAGSEMLGASRRPLPPVAEEGEEHAQPRPAPSLPTVGKHRGYISGSLQPPLRAGGGCAVRVG